MKNIHLLPTDKPSMLKQNNITKKISLVNKGIDLTAYTPINIYITSPNEDINENDYIITKDGRLVQVSYLLSKDIDSASKVTLATDVDLIKDGVQAIDDEFLEWFVKNPSCEEVKVEDYGNLYNFRYLIIIPKEELKMIECYFTPRKDTSSATICDNCGQEKFLHTIGEGIKVSTYIVNAKEELKQETLEEAAEKLTNDFPALEVRFNMSNEEIYGWFLEALQKGAKWQQERMYSEEEVMDMFHNLSMHLPLHYEFLVKEQFKNK